MEFAAKCEFVAQEYGTWFSDEHKRDAGVTFDIFASRGTDLCCSELFSKGIRRAKKSTLDMKIRGQVLHTVVFRLLRTKPRATAWAPMSAISGHDYYYTYHYPITTTTTTTTTTTIATTITTTTTKVEIAAILLAEWIKSLMLDIRQSSFCRPL